MCVFGVDGVVRLCGLQGRGGDDRTTGRHRGGFILCVTVACATAVWLFPYDGLGRGSWFTQLYSVLDIGEDNTNVEIIDRVRRIRLCVCMYAGPTATGLRNPDMSMGLLARPWTRIRYRFLTSQRIELAIRHVHGCRSVTHI